MGGIHDKVRAGIRDFTLHLCRSKPAGADFAICCGQDTRKQRAPVAGCGKGGNVQAAAIEEPLDDEPPLGCSGKHKDCFCGYITVHRHTPGALSFFHLY